MPQNRETVAETTPFGGVTALVWRLWRSTHPGPNEQTTLSDAKKRATYSLRAVLDTIPSKFFPELNNELPEESRKGLIFRVRQELVGDTLTLVTFIFTKMSASAISGTCALSSGNSSGNSAPQWNS